jgi:hypothetical protein
MRDWTQVIYRRSDGYRSHKQIESVAQNTKKLAGPGPSYSENPVIFTVDQLWLWIIDDSMYFPLEEEQCIILIHVETIVSSFPERWAQNDFRESKVLESIQIYLRKVGRRQVANVHEMAALIMSMCLRFVDKCHIMKDEEPIETFLQAFASEVRKVVSYRLIYQ